MVEALLKVVRILVRGEEAELGWEVDDQEEFGEFGKQEVEFDSKAELETATPPHLQKHCFRCHQQNCITFALRPFLEIEKASEERGWGSLGFQPRGSLPASQR